ncbi:unnamed protein product [Adineta steineri]|uniref:G-protein coupled receptors family 1 profile domain-containing protein n=1 Tax=Adineta steineri TaxID=433720 RepID=A0A819AT79_9BILA|nr:unnamed protein product [Adineta steineri]
MSVLTSPTFVELVNTTLNSSVTTTTTEIKSTMPIWIRIFLSICMILIDISAFFGNLLVICAFYRTRRLQTVTNYFIASLAFADALVALFVLPLSILYFYRDWSWTLGLILCDLWVSSDVLLCTSSILNLTCISIDRYMAITRPLTYTAYRSKFLARVMILLVWIVSIVITCPPIFGWRDPNRYDLVVVKHKCELNNARGYVVYSALGSFFIPAVVMIFVYIRIFMVVYDRENIIKKFHVNDTITPAQNLLKSNQNGKANAKNSSDGTYDNNKNLIKRTKTSFCCCCLCFQKKSHEDKLVITHQTVNDSRSNSKQKQNHSFIYRFPNKNTHINTSKSAPNTPLSISKKATTTTTTTTTTTIFCRPCTISTKKMTNLSDEIYHYRRNYLSGIGAEYQFRSGDSPCYELKTFQDSLPPLIKCRSHSFEQSPTRTKRDLPTEFNPNGQLQTSTMIDDNSTNFNNKQSNKANCNLLSNEDNKITKSLSELTQDIARLSMLHQTKAYEINYPNTISKSSSLYNQNVSNNSTYLNNDAQKSPPEQTRINRRIKPSRLAKSTPSELLIENFKQQYKTPLNNNQALAKSTQSLSLTQRTSENNRKKSKCSCCCCFSPLNTWCEKKNKQIYKFSPNQSVTNDDDDDDDKLSSNDTQTRTPIAVSNTNLRGRGNSHQNVVLSSHHHHHHPLLAGNATNPSHDVHRRERIRFMKEQKTAKTLAIVVGGFILFWLPFFIMYVIPPKIHGFSDLTATLITWLGYFNSVINPFIYAYCSKQFRMAFWNITFGICIKKSTGLLPISAKK